MLSPGQRIQGPASCLLGRGRFRFGFYVNIYGGQFLSGHGLLGFFLCFVCSFSYCLIFRFCFAGSGFFGF